MKISLALIALVSAPVLITVTACAPPAPIIGTVTEKEYEPPVYGKKTVDVTQRSCTTRLVNGQSKTTCKDIKTGTTTKPYLKKSECWELDILTSSGESMETCDKAAYDALKVGDRYDSSKDYTR